MEKNKSKMDKNLDGSPNNPCTGINLPHLSLSKSESDSDELLPLTPVSLGEEIFNQKSIQSEESGFEQNYGKLYLLFFII